MTGLVRLPFRTNSATARPRSKSGLRDAAEARDSAWAQFVHPRLFKGNDCGKPSAAVHVRRPQRPKGATAASGETAGWAEGRYLYSAWTTPTPASRTMLTGCGARRLAQI